MARDTPREPPARPRRPGPLPRTYREARLRARRVRRSRRSTTRAGALLGPASDRGVEPVYYDGNPQINGTNAAFFNAGYAEYRIEDLNNVNNGFFTYSDGYLKLNISVSSDKYGASFDWEIADGSTIKAIPGIFVKGGSGGNWYNYSTFADVSGVVGADYDGYLHSPQGAANGDNSGTNAMKAQAFPEPSLPGINSKHLLSFADNYR